MDKTTKNVKTQRFQLCRLQLIQYCTHRYRFFSIPIPGILGTTILVNKTIVLKKTVLVNKTIVMKKTVLVNKTISRGK